MTDKVHKGVCKYAFYDPFGTLRDNNDYVTCGRDYCIEDVGKVCPDFEPREERRTVKDYREEKKRPLTQGEIEEMVLGDQPFAEQNDYRNAICPVLTSKKGNVDKSDECLNSEWYPNEQTYLCRLAEGNELSNIPQICEDYKGMFYVNRERFLRGRIDTVFKKFVADSKKNE